MLYTYRAEKLFNGKVSVRDYLVQQAIQKGGLIIDLNGEKMILNKMQLINDGIKDPNVYRKQWGGGVYQLVDFLWNPDRSQLKIFSPRVQARR